MRRLIAIVLAATIVAATPAALPAAVRAPRQEGTGSIQGVAHDAQRQILANHTVQVRNVQTGQLVGTGTTNQAGSFSFAGLQPGNYVVEIINAAGQIVGATAPIPVAAGTVAAVTVTASAAGALAAAGGAGFGIFGLSTAASAAIIGGVAVGITAGVVATTNNASPSK